MSAEAVEVECIRRWYSVWSSCPCLPCRTLHQRIRKLTEAGLITRTTSEQAWAVIDDMTAAEWSPAAIASATKLTDRCITSLLDDDKAGHRRKIGPAISARIVTHGEPTRGYVGAVGARRKVRALAVLKHSQETIAAAGGLPLWTTIAAIQRGDTRRVSPRVAAAVDRAWRTLNRTIGTSQKSADLALRAGWHGVGAWHNIDDPNEIHDDSAADPSVRGARTRAVVELTAAGLGQEQVAIRLGIQVTSVARTLRRVELRAIQGGKS